MMNENRVSWGLGHLLDEYCKPALVGDANRRPLPIFRYVE